MTDKTPQEVLREAAEYISEHGWTQDRYRDKKTGAVCALGAIGIATGCLHELSDGAYFMGTIRGKGYGDLMEGAIRLLNRQIEDCVPGWNDAPERTAEDVILAMKRAAEDA